MTTSKQTHPPSKTTKTPNQIQKPNPNSGPSTTSSPFTLSREDTFLSHATHLTRRELLNRRSHNLKQLARCYRDHYWGLMEEFKVQHREYYWTYGVSPIKEEILTEKGVEEKWVGENELGCVDVEFATDGNGSNMTNYRGESECLINCRCLLNGCKLKAMALSNYCHMHILSDPNQKLYQPCGYVIKSVPAGPIACGKPIMNSVTPPLCAVHFQTAQKHLTRALRKAGLNISSSSKLAPKLHVLLAEFVRQIQAKRRALTKQTASRDEDK